MKKSRIVLVVVFFGLLLSSAVAQYTNVVIDGTTGNGDFQNNDPFEVTPSSITVTSNTVGRRLISNSALSTYITIPGWRLDREYYSSGNGAWGVDSSGAGAMPGAPNIYFFGNSGDFLLTSDTYPVLVGSGAVVMVSFDMTTQTMLPTNAASCSGSINFGAGQVFSWAASNATVTAAESIFTFTTNFVLTADATSVSLELLLSAGRDGLSSASQTKLDNVSLVIVSANPPPEPPDIYIDGDTGNGNFQNNDPFTAVRGTTSLTIITNATGRRLVANSNIGVEATWPGWTAVRTYYSGGNNAWGLDNGKYEIAGAPNVAWFVNSGDFTLTSDTYPASLSAGDTVTISFDYQAGALYTTPGTGVAASVTGEIDFGGGHIYSWSTNEASVTQAQVVHHFSKQYVLTNNVDGGVTLRLFFSTGRGENDDPLRSANQCHMDNVRLVASAGVSGNNRVVSIIPQGGDVYKLEVDVGNLVLLYPVASGDLVLDSWARLPHSDNGVNPFVQTNLSYSGTVGTNRVIYVQSAGGKQFFAVGKD